MKNNDNNVSTKNENFKGKYGRVVKWLHRADAFLTAAQSYQKNYDFYGKISFIKVYRLLLTSNGKATGIDFIKMTVGKCQMN